MCCSVFRGGWTLTLFLFASQLPCSRTKVTFFRPNRQTQNLFDSRFIPPIRNDLTNDPPTSSSIESWREAVISVAARLVISKTTQDSIQILHKLFSNQHVSIAQSAERKTEDLEAACSIHARDSVYFLLVVNFWQTMFLLWSPQCRSVPIGNRLRSGWKDRRCLSPHPEWTSR